MFPSPGVLPDPGIKLVSPALAGGFFFSFFYLLAIWEAPMTEFILQEKERRYGNHPTG